MKIKKILCGEVEMEDGTIKVLELIANEAFTAKIVRHYNDAEQQPTAETKAGIHTLAYNKYKGSGKCWIARIIPETKKIIDFLEAESTEKRDNYSGWKTFLVPLVEGAAYQLLESGSKSNDRNWYRIVRAGKLEEL